MRFVQVRDGLQVRTCSTFLGYAQDVRPGSLITRSERWAQSKARLGAPASSPAGWPAADEDVGVPGLDDSAAVWFAGEGWGEGRSMCSARSWTRVGAPGSSLACRPRPTRTSAFPGWAIPQRVGPLGSPERALAASAERARAGAAPAEWLRLRPIPAGRDTAPAPVGWPARRCS